VPEREVKNLGKGQMQDAHDGRHPRDAAHAPARPPADRHLGARLEWELLPRIRHSREDSRGADLRFKDPQLASRYGRRFSGGMRG